MLRAHYRDAGLPQAFQILDNQDQVALIKRVLKALNVDDEKYPPRELMYFINSNKDAGRRPPAVEVQDEFYRRMTELYAEYERQCDARRRSRFRRAAAALLRAPVAQRDPARALSAALLARPGRRVPGHQSCSSIAGSSCSPAAHNAIFAVGDDDQSIYTFRGASARNMFDFEREFAQGRVIKLEQNYRSQGNILDAANALISHNNNRLGKNLWTAEGSSEPLRLYEAPTDLEEAAFIVDEVKALRSSAIRLSQIALLYRSNAQSRVLEHALFNAALPYRVYGGLRFFERQEIKHALAYLRLVTNPDDDGAFLRVVNIPARGIGGRTSGDHPGQRADSAASVCGRRPARRRSPARPGWAWRSSSGSSSRRGGNARRCRCRRR